jgi:hypothetical protein
MANDVLALERAQREMLDGDSAFEVI